ncbi:MAG TPA: hypothetical protein VM618_08000, partial [Acidimicrobiia bacterium]|nr:hypothetical protein [Acidimicrobiia bacterium]
MNPLRRIAAAGVVAALAVGVSPTPSQAQTEGGLGGFALEALAVPVSVIFDMPSANIPAAPLMEWDLAYSRARLESGPIGHALASPLWPGEAVGTIGPFLSSEVNNQMRQNGAPDGVQAPTIPSWPGKAEAFHPQGPTTDDRSLGGPAQMRATAEANITEA